MIFYANFSSFSNSERLPENKSLCGHMEHFSISIYDTLKFEKNISKYYRDTLCV